jgi:hypothetical protein
MVRNNPTQRKPQPNRSVRVRGCPKKKDYQKNITGYIIKRMLLEMVQPRYQETLTELCR